MMSSEDSQLAGGAHRLSCKTKDYAWGVLARNNSKVAEFAAQTPGATIDADAPYAELWMGAHPSGPAEIIFPESKDSCPLGDILNRTTLGENVYEKYNGELPFLFKVLSVRKALSIQAHPDKSLAKKLHAARPDVYKDANHKPEMAVALTDFEALCGFRPLQEIIDNLNTYPEFRKVATEEDAANFEAAVRSSSVTEADKKKALKALFRSIMTTDSGFVASQALVLSERLKDLRATKDLSPLDRMIVRISDQYPGDGGIFCALMFNHIELKPGQAMFLSANEPHAYLAGDCVECMAASDNVVRAGLTPKFKDVDVLVDMLTYRSGPPSKQIMTPVPFNAEESTHTLLYDPPIEEFSIMQTLLPIDDNSVSSAKGAETILEVIPPLDGPSIMIIAAGGAKLTTSIPHLSQDSVLSEEEVLTGHVYFIPANVMVKLEKLPDSQEPALIYRAFCEVSKRSG